MVAKRGVISLCFRSCVLPQRALPVIWPSSRGHHRLQTSIWNMFSRIARPSLAVCSSARNFSSSSQVCTFITLIVKRLTILYYVPCIYVTLHISFNRYFISKHQNDFAIGFLCGIMNYAFFVSYAFFSWCLFLMIMHPNNWLNLSP